MELTLKIWRQKNINSEGVFKKYHLNNVNPDMSFLEMLDMLNNNLIKDGEDPIAFDHDCREGVGFDPRSDAAAGRCPERLRHRQAIG